MRLLLFAGKGGVGKTSLAAATGLRLAKLGKRTLVMSVDPAHSVGDAFDLGIDLFTKRTSDPYSVVEHLDIQEVNIQVELKRHWREISGYVASVLRTTGVTNIEAEELAILPGMEELSAMMYVNQYVRERRYDVIVLDCAPTAESLRFVSMPTTLDWYIKHIFPVQRNLLRAVRPIANRVSPVELPPDRYFANVLDLFQRLDGIENLLCDPATSSVRLVTNAERMVLRETQRAYVYFSLYNLTVDRITVNRLLPDEVTGDFFKEWHRSQQRILAEMDEYFDPVPVRRLPLLSREVAGLERLEELAGLLYPEDEDPSAVTTLERPYQFEKQDGRYLVRLSLPFVSKSSLELFKKGDELVVQIGTIRRHVGLPTSMAHMMPSKASLEDKMLTVEMKERI
ncbi:MAG TPA: ArsA family ATPase [Vicinamibacterales bacterium]|jgi:arsenite-transporting ATPase|nr:ArsA family ATPase [Vicinamibacterales bacterium]